MHLGEREGVSNAARDWCLAAHVCILLHPGGLDGTRVMAEGDESTWSMPVVGDHVHGPGLVLSRNDGHCHAGGAANAATADAAGRGEG